MRNKLQFVTLGLGLAASIGVNAGSLTFGSGNGSAGGGEFNVTASTDFGAFKTFCLEHAEYISIPGNYTYTINTAAVGGGPATVPGTPGSAGGADPISFGTVWLYSQFSAGTLSENIGGLNIYDKSGDENDVQKAIWYLEGESNGVNNDWVQAAMAALAKDIDQIRADADAAYLALTGVVVLNVGSGNQDVLAKVPDSGVTLGMFGAGLLGLGIARRRLA